MILDGVLSIMLHDMDLTLELRQMDKSIAYMVVQINDNKLTLHLATSEQNTENSISCHKIQQRKGIQIYVETILV